MSIEKSTRQIKLTETQYGPKVICSVHPIGRELQDKKMKMTKKGNSKRRITHHFVLGLGGRKPEGETEGVGLE